MMIRSLALIVLLTLSVCACGREAATPQRTAAASKQQSPASSQQQNSTTAQSATPTAQNEAEQATAAQESAGDSNDEERSQTRSDVSLEHLAALPTDVQLPSGRWKPGVNYDPIVPAQPTGVAPGKVEVTEIFWLGCPHCYALEPFLLSWLKNKADYIEFVRVPVMWGPVHRAHARFFYTLQALGRPDLFEKAFETIQQQHNPLVASSDDETFKLQQDFAQANGISAPEFAKAYNSFTVNSNLQRAEQLTMRYQVQGVPLVVINGKYSTDVAKAGGSPGNLISLIDDLAAAEHRH